MNVTLGRISSTEIMVSWDGVPQIYRNGLITLYEVLYVPLDTFDGIIAPSSLNTSDVMLKLSNLQEYVQYNISVRAYSSVGPGPYSEVDTERTSEDG